MFVCASVVSADRTLVQFVLFPAKRNSFVVRRPIACASVVFADRTFIVLNLDPNT